MRKYELMVVIDSSPESDKIDRTVEKIQELLTGKGGNIISVDNWGRRRLAYEIQRRQYGHYTLFLCELDPNDIKDLNRQLRLNPMVIRHLIVNVHPKVEFRPLGKLEEDFAEEIPDLDTVNEGEDVEEITETFIEEEIPEMSEPEETKTSEEETPESPADEEKPE